MEPTKQLPANPFQRQPVTDRSRLAGRSEELERITYYLTLTAAGQSPHLALIGSRGVGKTSLLNAAKEIGGDLRLLVVRLNLDEEKTRSAARFWCELYSALTLAAAEAGAWGGLESETFAGLFGMLHARGAVRTAHTVLLLPAVFASNTGTFDDIDCPLPLIEADLRRVLAELRPEGVKGLALLIDEGDCVRHSKSLLQVLRNLFQSVPGASMVIAGTPELFDVVSDVFSPIPRQFFRIDVKAFPSLGETRELVIKTLGDEARRVAPAPETIRDLHELCMGEPAELQLYCHHMYRAVERGEMRVMELSPEICKLVVREYRASSTADVAVVLDAIEALPSDLLTENSLLQFRSLSASDLVALDSFLTALTRGAVPTGAPHSLAEAKVNRCLEELHRRGISESPTRLALKGMPLSGVFWKSLARLRSGEKANGWTWIDISLADMQALATISHISEGHTARRPIPEEEAPVKDVFESCASGRSLSPKLVRAARHIIEMARLAKRQGLNGFSDLRVLVKIASVDREFAITFPEPNTSLVESRVRAAIESREHVLQAFDVGVSIVSAEGWGRPDDGTVKRIAWAANIWFDKADFGLNAAQDASQIFLAGDVDGAAAEFEKLKRLRTHPELLNNLGYCRIVQGRVSEAISAFRESLEGGQSMLAEHNLGVGLVLNGELEAGFQMLAKSLHTLKAGLPTTPGPEVLCMLRLSSACTEATSVSEVGFEEILTENLALVKAKLGLR